MNIQLKNTDTAEELREYHDRCNKQLNEASDDYIKYVRQMKEIEQKIKEATDLSINARIMRDKIEAALLELHNINSWEI